MGKSKGQTSEGGKPFLFDPSVSSNQHEVFFDDNIDYGDCYIVQPISIRDLDRVHWATSLLQTHMCRVEPLEAIPDRSYFIDKLAYLESGYGKKLQVRSKLKAHIMKAKEKAQDLAALETVGEESYDAWRNHRKSSRNVKTSEHNVVIDGAAAAVQVQMGSEPKWSGGMFHMESSTNPLGKIDETSVATADSPAVSMQPVPSLTFAVSGSHNGIDSMQVGTSNSYVYGTSSVRSSPSATGGVGNAKSMRSRKSIDPDRLFS